MNIAQNVTGLDHMGLPTKDLEKTVAFYEGLGFSVAWKTDPGFPDATVAFLEKDGLVIETYLSENPAGFAGAWEHLALRVRDVDDAFKTLSEGGYEILDKAVNFLPFWKNGVRFFTIVGPNGEKVEFLQML